MSTSRLVSYLVFAGLLAVYPLLRGSSTGIGSSLGTWFGGFLLWTLAEYFTHRFLFHPWGLKRTIRLVPRLLITHGRHHRTPEEMEVGLLPVYRGVPILVALGAIFYLFVGKYAFLLLSGFTVGYIGYMVLHYAIHRGAPPSPWLQPLWRQHLLHHTTYPNRCFGVTTTWWDRLFGTMPKGGAASPSSR